MNNMHLYACQHAYLAFKRQTGASWNGMRKIQQSNIEKRKDSTHTHTQKHRVSLIDDIESKTMAMMMMATTKTDSDKNVMTMFLQFRLLCVQL